MSIGWSSLTFTPDQDAIDELAVSWVWLLKDPYTPVLFSVLGDVFFARDAGDVWWLNTGTAQVMRVANSVDHFRELLDTDIVDEWFMPLLVEQLHLAGKVSEPGECYTYLTLPIFPDGLYDSNNLNPVPAREHFAMTGHLHRELRNVPAGGKVKLKLVH
jgi:Domain of unknown function (DUF1851)